MGENVWHLLPGPFLAGTQHVSILLLKATAPMGWLSPATTAIITATTCSGFQELLLPLIPSGVGVEMAPQYCYLLVLHYPLRVPSPQPIHLQIAIH